MTSMERRDHTLLDRDIIVILKQTSHLRTSSTCSLVEASHQVSRGKTNVGTGRLLFYTGAVLSRHILVFMIEVTCLYVSATHFL